MGTDQAAYAQAVAAREQVCGLHVHGPRRHPLHDAPERELGGRCSTMSAVAEPEALDPPRLVARHRRHGTEPWSRARWKLN